MALSYPGKDRLYAIQMRHLGAELVAGLDEKQFQTLVTEGCTKVNAEMLLPWSGHLPEDFDSSTDQFFPDWSYGELAWLPKAREAATQFGPINGSLFGLDLAKDVVLECERCTTCCDQRFRHLGKRADLDLGNRVVRQMSYAFCRSFGAGDCVNSDHLDDEVYDPSAKTHTWRQLQKKLQDDHDASFATLYDNLTLAASVPLAPCIWGRYMDEHEDYAGADVIGFYRGYRVWWHGMVKALRDQGKLIPSVVKKTGMFCPWGDLVTDYRLQQAGFIDEDAIESLYGLDTNAVACLLRWPAQWEHHIRCLNAYAGVRYRIHGSKRADAKQAIARLQVRFKRVLEAERGLMARRNMDALDIFKAKEKDVEWVFCELHSAIVHDERPKRVTPKWK